MLIDRTAAGRQAWCIAVLNVDPESLRFRFRYFCQNQIWTQAIVKSLYKLFLRIFLFGYSSGLDTGDS